MAAFNFRRRKTRRWWYVGTTLLVAAFFAVFFVTSSAALNNSPSNFEAGDGNMTLGATGNTDWNCFQGTDGFATLTSGTPAGCAVTSGATNNSSPNPDFEQTPGQKFDTACPTFKTGNNPPKDVWSDVAQYLEASPNTNSDGGHDLYFYGASIRPVVNGNSSGNIYFSQGTNPAGAGCRTVGDVLLTFDFLGGGSKPTLHILTWQGPSGSCFVGSDSPSTGCWGPSTPPTITGANSDGETNASTICGSSCTTGSDNALNNQTVLANGFSEIGVNLIQAIKQAGGGASCFANETWVSRSSGSSFTSSPEMVVIDQQPTCGEIKIIKQTNPRGLNQVFSFSSGSSTTSKLTANTNAGGVPCTTGGSAGVDSSGNFCLNDTGNTGKTLGSTLAADNSTGNTVDETLLQPGTYSVSESATDPLGFAFSSITCSPSASATISGRTATITLGIGGSVVCVFQNNQQLGAIKVNKTSTKGNAPLAGVTFQLKKGTTVISSKTTDSTGSVCWDGLVFGNDYSVQETGAPTGYKINDTSAHTGLTVGTNTTCAGTPSDTESFTDTPLSKIYLGWHSLAGTGVTTATIDCGGGAVAFSDGGSTPTITKTLGDGSTTLTPGTYTCTVVIDP